ncbi:uncharacterized protein LOC106008481 isoform X7 [Heterocephalus glaber]|uniref:Uncharacterized protein LOC106008481 isoform X7 n=1 Tax=Heterocephalus glaber TaxID=10181 RepID=A0AAX6SDD4_HETGA|nr:uncharacterized protein LOC106008481 isoform X7 [Heterocephalus glaber]
MMAAGSTANCLALGSDIAPAWSPVSPQCVRGRRGTRRLLTGRKKVWKSIVLQIGTQIGKKTRDQLIKTNQRGEWWLISGIYPGYKDQVTDMYKAQN